MPKKTNKKGTTYPYLVAIAQREDFLHPKDKARYLQVFEPQVAKTLHLEQKPTTAKDR